ncbi:hypothetical protein FOL47_010851 [Perkinsus chesapeaki]|uniref:Uncharacterized protein n=1 Tax=Perkinsus chesapeaki TaxID=330153 RepID=A0A7J6L285_PERCH|nr:hypothetical protein FOL47_010851 [Perkinsus chesapeaki]
MASTRSTVSTLKAFRPIVVDGALYRRLSTLSTGHQRISFVAAAAAGSPLSHFRRCFNSAAASSSECGIRRGLVGWTDLELAVSTGNLSEVRRLIACGADPRATNENGQTPLHFAAVNGNPKVIDLLIKEGADLNAEDTCGRIPLVLAVQQKQDSAARALIHYKPSISTEQLLKAVQLAQSNDDENMLSILREAPSTPNPDPKDQEYDCMGIHIEGNTRAPWEQEDAHARTQAADSSVNAPDVRCVSEKPQDRKEQPAEGSDEFDIASLEERRRNLFSLLNGGEELSSAERTRVERALAETGKRMHEIESLIQSAIFGQLERMTDIVCNRSDLNRMLLNIDSTDELGWSPLHWAAYKGHNRVAEFLLEHGADTNKLTKREGASALVCAVARKDSDAATRLRIVQALLEHGADVNAADGDGETPLHFAVGFVDYEVARVLLENGADPSIRTRYSITVGENNFAAGSTALHYAHQLRADNMIRLIASYAGCSQDIDREEDYSRSTYHEANVTRDSNGHTPVQVHPRWPCYMI